jgi:hypothetical protein
VTPRLHLAPGIPPAGAPMADLAVLWCDLLDGMNLDDLTQVQFTGIDGGTIDAWFMDVENVITWAEALGGLPFVREHIGGRTFRVTAAGPVTRNERTAVVRLSANVIDRSAA